MKRDILNYLGQKIGELELPDDTPEEVWTEKLSVYAVEPLTKNKISPISAKQIRLALLGVGVDLNMIDSAIGQMPEPEKSYAKITWEYATVFEREHPMIEGLGLQLGLTVEQIDELFIGAAQL